MNACEDYIEAINKVLPDICTTKDLIKIGIFKSDQAAAYARKEGLSPDYFKLPTKTIFYPKKGVIEFLRKSMYQCDPQKE